MASLFDWFVAQPLVYNAIQRFVGLETTRGRLAPYLVTAANSRVLDVGGGTGLYRSVVPAGARYYLLDIDPVKLRGFTGALPNDQCLLGDATRLGLDDKSIDFALCIFVAHHMADAQLAALVVELARVVRTRLIFLDPLTRPTSAVSRLLWRYDRGSYPRSAEVLTRALEAHFVLEQAERYAIYHDYLLWVGRPNTVSDRPGSGRLELAQERARA